MAKEEFFFENDGRTMIIRRTEDVEPIIEAVKQDRNNLDNGFSVSRNYRKIGSLPAIIIEQWLREKGINLLAPENEKHLRAALNEMNAFRTVDKPL